MENKNMWLAICELGDYFSRFAGGNRHRNMSESEIFLGKKVPNPKKIIYFCLENIEVWQRI